MISENENNYFRFNLKKATNLSKLYLLPKLHKGLCNIPGRPVTSNCGTPTEKVLRILGSPFTAYNETGRVVHKRHRRFFSKT